MAKRKIFEELVEGVEAMRKQRVVTGAAKLSGGSAATSWGTEEDAVFAGTSLPWRLQ
jgi:hypothetical protein